MAAANTRPWSQPPPALTPLPGPHHRLQGSRGGRDTVLLPQDEREVPEEAPCCPGLACQAGGLCTFAQEPPVGVGSPLGELSSRGVFIELHHSSTLVASGWSQA